jgi:hypothetical protein
MPAHLACETKVYPAGELSERASQAWNRERICLKENHVLANEKRNCEVEARREQARQHDLEMKIWVGYGCDIADMSRKERSWQPKVCRVCSENQSRPDLEYFCFSRFRLGLSSGRCNAHLAWARLPRTLYLHEAAGPAPLAASESAQLSESGSRHSGPCPEHHSFTGHCDSCPISDLTPSLSFSVRRRPGPGSRGPTGADSAAHSQSCSGRLNPCPIPGRQARQIRPKPAHPTSTGWTLASRCRSSRCAAALRSGVVKRNAGTSGLGKLPLLP